MTSSEKNTSTLTDAGMALWALLAPLAVDLLKLIVYPVRNWPRVSLAIALLAMSFLSIRYALGHPESSQFAGLIGLVLGILGLAVLVKAVEDPRYNHDFLEQGDHKTASGDDWFAEAEQSH